MKRLINRRGWRCAEVLRSELGVEPAAQTTALEAAVRDGSATPDQAVPAARLAPFATASSEVDLAATAPRSRPGKPSVVVLPFVSLGTGTDHDYLADGLTMDVMVNLSRYRELLVIDEGSAFAFRDASADARQFARRVDVEYLVKGNVLRAGDQVRISVQLLESATGGHLWAD